MFWVAVRCQIAPVQAPGTPPGNFCVPGRVRVDLISLIQRLYPFDALKNVRKKLGFCLLRNGGRECRPKTLHEIGSEACWRPNSCITRTKKRTSVFFPWSQNGHIRKLKKTPL